MEAPHQEKKNRTKYQISKIQLAAWEKFQALDSQKILIYNQILKPVWLYGCQLWGCAKVSNIQIIQRFQNKVLRNIVNAPWYVRYKDIHRDMQISIDADEIKKMAVWHQDRLQHHTNAEALHLLDNQLLVQRLKRTKPLELV